MTRKLSREKFVVVFLQQLACADTNFDAKKAIMFQIISTEYSDTFKVWWDLKR